MGAKGAEPPLLKFLFILVGSAPLNTCINLAFQSVLTLLPMFLHGIAMRNFLTAGY